MSAANGEVLFDVPLKSEKPLEDLWQEAEPFNPDPSRLTARFRLDRANGLLLRSHAKLDYKTEYDGQRLPVPARLELAKTHVASLREFGVSVVSHAAQPANRDNGHDVVAYSASRYVPGAVRLDNPNAAREISRRKVEELVVEPLQRYYLWCRETGATFVLSDVEDPHQYSWHIPSGTVFLHDIDPKVAQMPAAAHDDEIVEDIARNFENVGV